MCSYANDVQILPFLPRSLGLVLPSYSENHIKANLSDQILQVQCKYQGQANAKPAYLSFFPKKLPVPPPRPSRPINGGPSPFLWHHSSVGSERGFPGKREWTCSSVKPHPTSSLFPPVLMLFCTEVIFLSLLGCKEKTLTKNQRGESCGFTVFTELKIMVTMCYYFSFCRNIKKCSRLLSHNDDSEASFVWTGLVFLFSLARCEKRHAFSFHCVLYVFTICFDSCGCSLCCIVCRQLWNQSINKKKVSHNAPWWAIVPHGRWNAFGFLSFLVFCLFFFVLCLFMLYLFH